MKVIFIEDVPSVARVGQTKVVADGYARNYLLPRKLAVLADSRASAAIESQLKKKIKQLALEDAEMAALAKTIEGTEIILRAKVGENEKLYGSITGADIAEALTRSAGREIDKRKIELAEPIRQTGSHGVTVRFTHDVTAVIKVNVISEDAVEEKPARAEKAEKAEKPARAEKAEKPEKAKKAARAEKVETAGKPEKPKKAKKAAKAEAPETVAAPEAVAAPGAEAVAEKAEKKAKPRAPRKTRKAEAKVEATESKETESGE
ncbi:MAG: 50S ribosomal protein L9 [Chloroflexi bacterium RBG_16_58_8]|nr:MAG: 50S ribosomal protein L9 [Chloroflexi bacterium RBG_16_58_8]